MSAAGFMTTTPGRTSRIASAPACRFGVARVAGAGFTDWHWWRRGDSSGAEPRAVPIRRRGDECADDWRRRLRGVAASWQSALETITLRRSRAWARWPDSNRAHVSPRFQVKWLKILMACLLIAVSIQYLFLR